MIGFDTRAKAGAAAETRAGAGDGPWAGTEAGVGDKVSTEIWQSFWDGDTGSTWTRGRYAGPGGGV